MKTQILQLDTHDDFISVRDKLAWKQAGRILLVWPEHGHILERQLDLLLLQRHSRGLGAQLAFVTRDPEVQFQAAQLGIPVFDNPRQAQRVNWRICSRQKTTALKDLHPQTQASTTRQELEQARQQVHPTMPGWVSHLLTRVLLFMIGLSAVLVLGAFLLPGAQINLYPEIKNQALTFDVQSGAEIQSLNLSGALPAHPVSVVVEGRDSLPSSGVTQIPVSPARGEVVFKTLTNQSIEIPAGTSVITLEVPYFKFVTDQAVTIAADPGATVAAAVHAVTPGSRGNRPADTQMAVEGSLGLLLNVTNPQAMVGGTDQQTAAPTGSDRSELYKRLVASLQQSAIQEINKLLLPGDQLLDPVPALDKVVEQKYIPVENSPAETLELTLRLEFKGLAVSALDMNRLALVVLDANLPADYTANPGGKEIIYTQLTPPVWDAKHEFAHWQLQAERLIRLRVDVHQVTALISGLSLADARRTLEANLSLREPPQIVLYPSWWPRLPFLPMRISVVVQ